MKRLTSEERLLLEFVKKAGGDYSQEFDAYLLGESIGLRPKASKQAAHYLCQCNCIKKVSKTEFCLTPHGESVAAGFG